MSAGEASEILWFCFGIPSRQTAVRDFGLGWDQAQERLRLRAVVLLTGWSPARGTREG